MYKSMKNIGNDAIHAHFHFNFQFLDLILLLYA